MFILVLYIFVVGGFCICKDVNGCLLVEWLVLDFIYFVFFLVILRYVFLVLVLYMG